MPELPEVHTTATGINKEVKGLKITDVWTNYDSSFHAGKNNIKNKHYFVTFRNECLGKKIIGASRRGKNVLIHLKNNKTILVHMKMTGHIMYGTYKLTIDKKDPWKATEAGPLRDDSFNKWIHLVWTLSNNRHLVLSDMRKFAKVTLLDTSSLETSADIRELGPEPLEKEFTLKIFIQQILKRPTSPIKQVLMDQSLIAGIGNIYSDEILWKCDVHPESKSKKIPNRNISQMFKAIKETLKKGIYFGGDSMSDYRNIYGERGQFQYKHNAYRLTGETCEKRGCDGTIQRKIIGGRSGHFCDAHQILYS